MGSDTTLSKICPILSIAGQETVCKGPKCAFFIVDDGIQYCAITLQALALDKMARQAEKYA
jgi:hypothetical protein